jgi:hypothetical protein
MTVWVNRIAPDSVDVGSTLKPGVAFKRHVLDQRVITPVNRMTFPKVRFLGLGKNKNNRFNTKG